jgi:hypothetical protein
MWAVLGRWIMAMKGRTAAAPIKQCHGSHRLRGEAWNTGGGSPRKNAPDCRKPVQEEEEEGKEEIE